jgi:hypothetical protein
MENGPFIDGLHIKNEDFPWQQIPGWLVMEKKFNIIYVAMTNKSLTHG